MGSEWDVIEILVSVRLGYSSKSVESSKTISFFKKLKKTVVFWWEITTRLCKNVLRDPSWKWPACVDPKSFSVPVEISAPLQSISKCRDALSVETPSRVIGIHWFYCIWLVGGGSRTRHHSHSRLYVPSEDNTVILVETSFFDSPSFLFFIITHLPCPWLLTLDTCFTAVNSALDFYI